MGEKRFPPSNLPTEVEAQKKGGVNVEKGGGKLLNRKFSGGALNHPGLNSRWTLPDTCRKNRGKRNRMAGKERLWGKYPLSVCEGVGGEEKETKVQKTGGGGAAPRKRKSG